MAAVFQGHTQGHHWHMPKKHFEHEVVTVHTNLTTDDDYGDGVGGMFRWHVDLCRYRCHNAHVLHDFANGIEDCEMPQWQEQECTALDQQQLSNVMQELYHNSNMSCSRVLQHVVQRST